MKLLDGIFLLFLTCSLTTISPTFCCTGLTNRLETCWKMCPYICCNNAVHQHRDSTGQLNPNNDHSIIYFSWWQRLLVSCCFLSTGQPWEHLAEMH